MNTVIHAHRIPDEQLAELWFGFKHQVFNKIQVAFRASNFKQEDVAFRLGKQPATICRWLSGTENMTLRSMHDLARGMNYRLRIELDDLNAVRPTNRQHGKTWRAPEPNPSIGSPSISFEVSPPPR